MWTSKSEPNLKIDVISANGAQATVEFRTDFSGSLDGLSKFVEKTTDQLKKILETK